MDPLTGAKLWLLVKPIKRIRYALARRRARKNGTDLYDELPIDVEENNVFPRGTLTKTGGVVAGILGPVLTILIMSINGSPAECTVEMVAEGCVSAAALADQIAIAIGTLISSAGTIMVWRGRNRVNEPK